MNPGDVFFSPGFCTKNQCLNGLREWQIGHFEWLFGLKSRPLRHYWSIALPFFDMIWVLHPSFLQYAFYIAGCSCDTADKINNSNKTCRIFIAAVVVRGWLINWFLRMNICIAFWFAIRLLYRIFIFEACAILISYRINCWIFLHSPCHTLIVSQSSMLTFLRYSDCIADRDTLVFDFKFNKAFIDGWRSGWYIPLAMSLITIRIKPWRRARN